MNTNQVLESAVREIVAIDLPQMTNDIAMQIAREIMDDLLFMVDNSEESFDEIKRYMREFPQEPDYNIAQHGNLLVYCNDVRNVFSRCRYEAESKALSDSSLWELYKCLVGIVARAIIWEEYFKNI